MQKWQVAHDPSFAVLAKGALWLAAAKRARGANIKGHQKGVEEN